MSRPDTLYQSALTSLPLLGRGKVRDLYEIDPDTLLIVATDRISAFDCILPDAIPGKGRVLTALSNFWFARLGSIVPHHLLDWPLSRVLADPADREEVEGRAMVVRKLRPLPIEAVVRGYLAGSGWKEYQATGTVCGIPLPAGLRLAERLPEPIFTPATKAALGQHDENIPFERAAALIGGPLAEQVREVSLRLYREAAEHALARGIVIADTKFEFGLDAEGRLHWIDEALTPDSSRFWPLDGYQVGSAPPSFDKQFVRDYLDSLPWDKRPPAPHLPPEVIARTAAQYREAERRLTRP
ncbi:phosphoribosylaminoimidazolesuccinocarboxamide synthase [Candidatus Methylocalor cossyra]|uniref:Phosphoribosylaminoimidazole-succinocarboxamide synthase n=1 Tax=Candidatus Methylocalor cossyra TaxID=3108543 RepID=A0ABM9NL06_9GAMM